MTEALASVTTLTTSAISVITGNEYLMIFLIASLVGVGFTIFSRAKSTVQ